jgi:hypothetical protein
VAEDQIKVDLSATVYGIAAEEWQSAYRLGMQEFSAAKWLLHREGSGGLVRIAFGNGGPPINEQGQRGCAVYTHAVTMTEAMALDLVRKLRDFLASPAPKSNSPDNA